MNTVRIAWDLQLPFYIVTLSEPELVKAKKTGCIIRNDTKDA